MFLIDIHLKGCQERMNRSSIVNAVSMKEGHQLFSMEEL
jgi:hypothetical protein